MLFLRCRNCDSLTVVAVAHFNTHLAGRHLAAIGRVDNCFSRLQLLFVINISKTEFSLIPEASKSLFVHSLHL